MDITVVLLGIWGVDLLGKMPMMTMVINNKNPSRWDFYGAYD